MKPRYYIGVDPGRKTGYALWDSEKRKLVEIYTWTFWRLFDYVHPRFNPDNTAIVIEDPSQNRPTFYREGATRREMEKISQNVGANKEHAILLIERFESLGFEVLRVRPSKKTQTKLTAKAFERITGYSERTSEHARDAAMLVYGR